MASAIPRGLVKVIIIKNPKFLLAGLAALVGHLNTIHASPVEHTINFPIPADAPGIMAVLVAVS